MEEMLIMSTNNTGRKPGTSCAHSKIARTCARVLFVLYVVLYVVALLTSLQI